jgi:tetratricopeptide (TPR) repeat protein
MAVSWARRATEAVVLGMAVAAPWAFGAVDAWAQLGLYGAAVVLAVLAPFAAWGGSRAQRCLTCVPSLGLAGLVVLALVQSAPLSRAALQRIDPAGLRLRDSLLPRGPVGVEGEAGPTVKLPPLTISEDPDATFRTAMQLAAAWVLLQAVLGLGGETAPLRRFAIATACNAAGVAVYSIVQALTWNGRILGIREVAVPLSAGWSTGGPFVCHSHMAAYCNIGIGCALGLIAGDWLGEPSRRNPRRWDASRLWPAYIAAVCAAGVVTSHSRGALMALVAATIVTAALLGRKGAVQLALGAGVVLTIAGLFLAAVGSTSPFARILTIADPGARGYALRLEIWRAALEAWRAHPLVGTGLGSFSVATAPYFGTDHGMFPSHAEDEYVQVLCEGGVLGLGLALIALAGVVRLGLKALAAAGTVQSKGLVLGALFGASALVFQLVSDFTLHIPGVALTVVVLFGHLCRLGLGARSGVDRSTLLTLPLAGLRALVMIALAVLACWQGAQFARAEYLVRSVNLPWPGSQMPAAALPDYSEEELVAMRRALEQAVRVRPNWVEGHWRLGNTLLGLYRASTKKVLEAAAVADASGTEADQGQQDSYAGMEDPIWLHRIVHTAETGPAAMAKDLLEFEPVRTYLMPAARSYLEARRCCPEQALSHLRLGMLDFLLVPSEPSAVHAERALKQAGPHADLLLQIGRIAAQAGDRTLAARSWRRALEVREELWPLVADAAGVELRPEQILAEVLPPGARFPVLFIDRIYATPEDQAPRDLFLKAALEQLPRDAELDEANRMWVEGQVRARLDQRAQARKLMEEAIRKEPLNSEWRREIVYWLIFWGDPQEAHNQARTGIQLDPQHKGLQLAYRHSVDSLAAPPDVMIQGRDRDLPKTNLGRDAAIPDGKNDQLR